MMMMTIGLRLLVFIIQMTAIAQYAVTNRNRYRGHSQDCTGGINFSPIEGTPIVKLTMLIVDTFNYFSITPHDPSFTIHKKYRKNNNRIEI